MPRTKENFYDAVYYATRLICGQTTINLAAGAKIDPVEVGRLQLEAWARNGDTRGCELMGRYHGHLYEFDRCRHPRHYGLSLLWSLRALQGQDLGEVDRKLIAKQAYDAIGYDIKDLSGDTPQIPKDVVTGLFENGPGWDFIVRDIWQKPGSNIPDILLSKPHVVTNAILLLEEEFGEKPVRPYTAPANRPQPIRE